ncbi:MAG: DNA-directed RNA polymerase subunit B [Nitrososphaerota archaeon]
MRAKSTSDQPVLTGEDLWKVADAYIEDAGLISHHLMSYDYFVKEGLKNLILSMSPVDIKAKGKAELRFESVEIGSPRIVEIDGMAREDVTPAECRLRNLTYAAPIYVKMSLYIDDKPVVVGERVMIGSIPIMVKSSICPLSRMTPEELASIGEDPLDLGGYFIINGSERVIVAIEDLSPNKVLVTVKGHKENPQYSAMLLSSAQGRMSKVEVTYSHGGPIKVFFSRIYKGIPLIVMLRALGLTKDSEIVNLISNNQAVQELLEASFKEAEGIETAADALVYIGNRIAFGYAEEYRKQRAEQMIDNIFMLHVGTTPDSRYKKGILLCDMVGKLLETSLGLRQPSDKDHYGNKRLKLENPLLTELFRMALTKLIRDVKYQLERSMTSRYPITISPFVKPSIINDVVFHAFATGNWPGGRVGVTQLLNRTNYLATISHLRRVQSPLSRSQAHFEARDLHGTHLGRICPVETPEGANSGLVKNLALGAEVSVPLSQQEKIELKRRLVDLGMVGVLVALDEKRRGKRKSYAAKVYLDNELVGYHADGKALVRELRALRRKGEISVSINVCLNEYPHVQEVEIYTDEGRVRRPLIVVENGVPSVSKALIDSLSNGTFRFRDLVAIGGVEFLDASEEENILVAVSPEELSPNHQYLEISPLLMLGAVGSIIPYSNHNQSPRNVYEASMAKQALGVPLASLNLRSDSRLHLLVYPQKPLVTTRFMKRLSLTQRPIGQNMVVAVLTGYGYNMEDAVVLNKSAVERGLGFSISFRTYEVEAKQYMGGERDKLTIPEPSVRGYRGEQYYRALDIDGLAFPESEVTGGMAIVGMVSPPRFMEEYMRAPAREMVWRDSSEVVRPTEAGVVDTIWISKTLEETTLIKARVRTNCFAEIGDKFASRHGQKGVVGMLFAQADMPYTSSGIVPDLIINPHAFPSRMTVGQLIEGVAGKVSCLKGEEVDGSPFIGKPLEEIRTELEQLGFKGAGTEVMYDGLTGRRYEVEIFIGVVYYQRLHHLVRDKIHARSRGQVQILTRQPTEGRSRGGGLKFGEMERDCLIAYGASYLLLDRLLEQSDKYTAHFCEKCGLPAYQDLKQNQLICPVHGKDFLGVQVSMSYAFFLLLNELLSMGVYPKLVFEEVG